MQQGHRRDYRYDNRYDDRPPNGYDDYRGRGGPPQHDRRGDYGPHGGGGPPPYGPYGGGGGYRGGPPPHGGHGGGRGGGRAARRDEGPPGVSLLVRNVSTEITQSDLTSAFGRIGDVRDVYIPRDFHSQQPKGFAFVEFATHEQAAEAREEMDRFVVRGREIEVVFAQERRKTPDQMRGRVFTGGRRGGGRGGDRGGGDRDRDRDRDGRGGGGGGGGGEGGGFDR